MQRRDACGVSEKQSFARNDLREIPARAGVGLAEHGEAEMGGEGGRVRRFASLFAEGGAQLVGEEQAAGDDGQASEALSTALVCALSREMV